MTKAYKCVYDFDTHLYTGSKMLQDDYIVATHKETGYPLEFKNITTFKGRSTKVVGGWLADRNEEKGTDLHWDDFDITNHVRRNDKTPAIPKKLMKASIDAVLRKDWCRELKLVIGGTDNYRKKLWPEYKANRPAKPIMYVEMREWLESKYKDIVVVATGCEADDYLSIMVSWMRNHCKDDFDLWDLVLVHRDKDMIQCGGLQWDWFKKLKEPIWITEMQMTKSFWSQMLQGDTTDNIPGLKCVTEEVWKNYSLKGKRGIGEAHALTLLADCETPLQMEEKVLYFYKTYYEDKGEDWQKHFQLNYQMLKLMETKGIIPEYKF